MADLNKAFSRWESGSSGHYKKPDHMLVNENLCSGLVTQ